MSCRFLILIPACWAKRGSETPPRRAQATEEDSKCGRTHRGRSRDHHSAAGELGNRAVVEDDSELGIMWHRKVVTVLKATLFKLMTPACEYCVWYVQYMAWSMKSTHVYNLVESHSYVPNKQLSCFSAYVCSSNSIWRTFRPEGLCQLQSIKSPCSLQLTKTFGSK